MECIRNNTKYRRFLMDEKYMLRAIELAKKGAGFTNPNPMVGAVIVRDGRIIGEGYHKKYGELHAERNAFLSLTEDAEGADMYVTLEPCCHYGKTPPCTEAIIEHKIARVFIGSRDPNPKVSGGGVKILREHGIEVFENVLKDECDKLNPVFFHYISTGMPYVVMKYAMTLDGKIATRTGKSKWITGEAARSHVHRLRARYAAIMCGIGTVLADNPMLNARNTGTDMAAGDIVANTAVHQPLRIVLDSKLRIPEDSRLVDTAVEYPTLVVYAVEDLSDDIKRKKELLKEKGVELLYIPGNDGRVNIRMLMEELGRRKIDSVLVEGGGEVHESLMREKLVNHVCCYIAPKIFGGRDAKGPVGGLGIDEPGDALRLFNMNTTMLGDDILLEYDCVEE